MRRFLVLAFAASLATVLLGVPVGARGDAGPTPGGMTSDNVEFIQHFPISVNGVGGRVVGKFFYTNDQHKVMIFDVSDPLAPALQSVIPMPQEYMYSREDLDTNGSILIVPNTASPQHNPDGPLPVTTSKLFVIDVEDKTNPQIIAEVPNAAQHTSSCILDCKWVYGSGGNIVDLRDPSNPVLLEERWGDGHPANGGHDVEEVAPGIVLTATNPIMLLDARKDPVHPKLLALGDTAEVGFEHTARWPGNATSDFLLMAGETNNRVQCNETNGAFQTWDARNWKKTHSFELIDKYRMVNGTFVDGNAPANVWGCSSHWHEANPRYGKHGGLVAAAFFEHGTRFIDITSKGKIKEVGWFIPFNGNTGAVYWITDRIAYAVDYNRGIDIIRWTGKF